MTTLYPVHPMSPVASVLISRKMSQGYPVQARFSGEHRDELPTHKPEDKKRLFRYAFSLFAGILALGGALNSLQVHRFEKEIQTEQAHLRTALSEEKERCLNPEEQKPNMEKLAQAAKSQADFPDLTPIVKMITPSVVCIEGKTRAGSGVLIQDSTGKRYILTSSYVTMRDHNAFRYSGEEKGIYRVMLFKGSDFSPEFDLFDATLLQLPDGSHAEQPPEAKGLALLEIPDDVELPNGVKPVCVRDVEKNPICLGETVIAVGDAAGHPDSVTYGIISHLNRVFHRNFWKNPEQNRLLQTDAAINPRNEGGGLFDIEGRLVGINVLTVEDMGIETDPPIRNNGLAGAIRIESVLDALKNWGISVAPGA